MIAASLCFMHSPEHPDLRRSGIFEPVRRRHVLYVEGYDPIGPERRAAEEAAAWPVDEVIDLSEYTRRMMRDMALELLFGGRNQQSCAIADRVSRLMERKWDSSVIAFPINLSVTPYGRVVRDAEILERLILEWVAAKRGHVDEGDLASIIVNSNDADGDQPDDAAIVGQLASLFAAASEASHSVLTWTLLLLQQYPRVAAVPLPASITVSSRHCVREMEFRFVCTFGMAVRFAQHQSRARSESS